ncbi:sodium hydrogen exchanger [Babesia ovis]|uniref:Sodium hydrogen exchanger n=1 Tax=Babesia ovis TaxID=5869 RepID=A0A9W5TEQ1_BABOV|nr:sodium hydrogen exchanger [Babesia ovis]
MVHLHYTPLLLILSIIVGCLTTTVDGQLAAGATINNKDGSTRPIIRGGLSSDGAAVIWESTEGVTDSQVTLLGVEDSTVEEQANFTDHPFSTHSTDAGQGNLSADTQLPNEEYTLELNAIQLKQADATQALHSKDNLDSGGLKPVGETENTGKTPTAVPPHVAQLIVLACFICLSACVLQFIISKINNKIPISIACFIFGMITYGFTKLFEPYGLDDPLSLSINNIRHIDSSVLYYGVLPILLYEATQDINWYAFCNFFLGGISLAIIGVVLQVCLLGVLFYLLNICPKNITISFLLASILSSTDPVAVLAVLNGVNAHPKLASMFNGESLINDGSSVLLFQFFHLLLVGESLPIWHHGLVFCKLLILSPLLGMLVGAIVTIWISIFRKYHSAQCLAVVTTAHLLYFVSEYSLNSSGPLAIVCYGLFIKAYGFIAFDREALEKHHHFVEGIALVANSAVFMISGALTIGMLQSQLQSAGVLSQLGKLIGIYILLTLARALMILVFKPLLSYVGYGLNCKEIILFIWGGLRGAIVLVMGLRLESDPNTPDEVSDLLAFYIGGNVMLILLIQGLTFEMLYRILHPYPMKPFRRVYLLKVMKVIDRDFSLEVDWLRTHWLFKNTDAVEYASSLVPKMATIRWNATGNLEFEVPDIDNVFIGRPMTSPIQTHVFQEGIHFEAMPHVDRCNTLYSCSVESDDDISEKDLSVPRVLSQVGNNPTTSLSRGSPTPHLSTNRSSSQVEDVSDEDVTDRPLLAYSILSNSGPKETARYDPKRYLQLLEHSVTDEPEASQESNRPYTTLSSLTNESAPLGVLQHVASFDSSLPAENRLTRSDTDATINLDNLFQRPVHKRYVASTVVPRMESDDHLFEDSEFEFNDGNASDTGPSAVRRVLRKDQEGELYIMIFNAFSDMYNKLYHSALIDGGSLLILQNTLDTSSDFALKKLQKRSIAAWVAVLAEAPPESNFVDGDEGVEGMDGFEFEWFVLHSMVEKRMRHMDGWLGMHFLIFSQHNIVQSVLELLVAYIDVHQHLLVRGGRNLELLLEGKLLRSYRAQIEKAKLYIATLHKRFPHDFGHGLVTMAACMMLRIKRDVVNEQSTQGLLLEEDRVRVVEVLDDQLFNVATTHNRISMFKRLFRRAFYKVTCWHYWCSASG